MKVIIKAITDDVKIELNSNEYLDLINALQVAINFNKNEIRKYTNFGLEKLTDDNKRNLILFNSLKTELEEKRVFEI